MCPQLYCVVTRVISVVGISTYLEVSYTIDRAGFLFDSQQEYRMVNSYSLVLMLTVISAGLAYVLIKSFFLHDTHIEPSLTARLFSLRLSSFIQTSFDIYSQGAIWLALRLFNDADLWCYGSFWLSLYMGFHCCWDFDRTVNCASCTRRGARV